MQVSAGAAYYSTGVFLSGCFWKLFGGAILVIAWLNLRWGPLKFKRLLDLQDAFKTLTSRECEGIFQEQLNCQIDDNTGLHPSMRMTWTLLLQKRHERP